MADNTEHETKAFMTAYEGLKSASHALEAMSHDPEPDLDKMLVQVKQAKRYYDKCNQVIEHIKGQVESIFSGSANVAGNDADRLQQEIGEFGTTNKIGDGNAPTVARRASSSSRGDMDDEIPF